MPIAIAELLARQLDDARDWTRKLIADLSGDEWFFQPAGGLAHPLWICGHLAGAQNTLIHTRCLGKSVLEEAFTEHFPIGGPVRSSADHAYSSVESVLDRMDAIHARTLEGLRGMGDDLLAELAWGKDGQPHPHYRDKMGAVSHCARHESFHAGQLATIRRLLGKPFLR